MSHKADVIKNHGHILFLEPKITFLNSVWIMVYCPICTDQMPYYEVFMMVVNRSIDVRLSDNAFGEEDRRFS